MHLFHTFATLAMTGCVAALPQSIPLDTVAEIPAAPITETPLGEGAGTKVVPYKPDAVVANTFASVLANPASADKTLKRRAWDCSEQPLGAGLHARLSLNSTLIISTAACRANSSTPMFS